MSETIVYEQPLNEIIRVCLRLEQLFKQVDNQFKDQSELGTRNLIALIINILHLLERPDLKAKIAKELNHLHVSYKRFSSSPKVDSEKLGSFMQKLEQLSHCLIDRSSKLGHRLRDIELLNMLRMHLASPGGGCSFDTPLYYYWLSQPQEEREATLKDWLSEFDQIRAATELLLDLMRNNTKTQEITAKHGFHQEMLDPQAQLRMLRIFVPAGVKAYPEVSVGRHFLSIRFFSPDIFKRPGQYPDDLSFVLGYCYS